MPKIVALIVSKSLFNQMPSFPFKILCAARQLFSFGNPENIVVLSSGPPSIVTKRYRSPKKTGDPHHRSASCQQPNIDLPNSWTKLVFLTEGNQAAKHQAQLEDTRR